jgi:riboflavin synthase
MFTGIITRKATITSLEQTGQAGTLVISAEPWERPLEIGESIAVSGVCLTLTRFDGDQWSFDILRETFDKTHLGQKKAGDVLNLERALCWGDALGGHVVSGHVDGVGSVAAIESVDRDVRIDIHCAAELLAGMMYKGSICIDGISLTIADLSDDHFSIHLIPHTWAETSLSALSVGDTVNLEVDLMGKFYRRMLDLGTPNVPITWDELRRCGLIDR